MSQTNDQTFGELLKKYRLNCLDPDRGGELTQARLVELLELEANVYTNSETISRWERDVRPFPLEDKKLHIGLLGILKKYSRENGLKTLQQANTWLAIRGIRDLSIEEAATIDPAWVQAGSQQPIELDGVTEMVIERESEPAEEIVRSEIPGENWGRWLAEWLKNFFRTTEPGATRRSYSDFSIDTLENIVNGVIGGNFALIITIFALWIFTNLLMSPMWRWQLDDPTVRFYAMIRFGFGSVTIPFLIAYLTPQDQDQQLNTDTWRKRAKLFYLKYTGAITAFNVFAVGYFLFPILPLSFSKTFSGLLTSPPTWILLSLPPIFFSHVTAQRIPIDRLNMKGADPNVLDTDRTFGTVFTFFGPGVAYLLYQNYEGFLDPFTGVAVLLFFITLYIWQQRQDKDHPHSMALTVLQFAFLLPLLATVGYLIINLEEIDFSAVNLNFNTESILSILIVGSYLFLIIAMYVITLQRNPPQVNFAGTVGLVLVMVLIVLLLRIQPYWGAVAFMTPFVIYPLIHRWLRPWFWVHPALVLAFALMFVSLALGLRELIPLWLNLTGFWVIAAGLMWWAFQPAYPT